MRTIDADELKKKLEAEHCDCEIMALIDNMPTAAEAANAKAAAIMQHYGAQHQLVKLCEECGELIQQAAKCADKETDYSEDMIEEMADVQIMLWQFRSLLNGFWDECFENEIMAKLRRQMERIETEKEDT